MEDWSFYYNQGIDLKEQADFEGALAAHLKVFEAEPNLEMPEAWHNVGAAYLRLNHGEKANFYLEKALTYYDQIIQTIRNFENSESDSDHSTDLEIDIDQISLNDLGVADTFGFTSNDSSSIETFDFPVFYENDRPAYYLYWKAGALALLNRKEESMEVLRNAIEEDEFYAIEAENEEDFTCLQSTSDFQNLIHPIIAIVKQPDHPNLFEMYDQIEQFVLLGFDAIADGVELLSNQFNDQYTIPISKAWIRMVMEQLYDQHLRNSRNWAHPTDVERLGAAFLDMWGMGIVSMHCVGDSELEARETIHQFVDAGIFNFNVKGYCCYDKAQILHSFHQSEAVINLYFNSISDDQLDSVKLGKQLVQVIESHGLSIDYQQSSSNVIALKSFKWQKVFVDLDNSDLFDYWDTLHPST
jgi:hypothetical protein